MLGKKDYQEKSYTNFQLSQRIPKDNFYRRLKGILDLHFLYKMVAPYYGKEGQKSIDPVVFFKLMLVSYLENIIYDRKLMDFVSMRLDILYFLNYDIDEELSWHSTISRTRKLFPKSMFEEVFNRVLKICVESGMVAGHTQAIDSAYIKANASLDSLEKKQPEESLEEHIAKTYNENNDEKPRRKAKQDKSNKGQRTIQSDKNQLQDLKTHQKWFKDKEGWPMGSPDPRARYLSNKTHYSPVDPDSRIAVKPGKPRQLCYQGNISVDTASHVITNIQANKIMLMAGTAYNIQKLMRYVQKTRKTAALSMRIMAEHIYLELNNAIFQFLELFVKDKKHLGYVITCYYKNKEDAVKLYKNNL
jgi:transposase